MLFFNFKTNNGHMPKKTDTKKKAAKAPRNKSPKKDKKKRDKSKKAEPGSPVSKANPD